MEHSVVLAFLTFGLTEIIVVGVVAVLLFGPRAARGLGSVGRTVLDLKRDVDQTKSSLRRQLTGDLERTLRGPSAKKDRTPTPRADEEGEGR
jgi:Sec-independent protein translocase protein TatA